jgi:hypothetical protein
LNNGERLYIAMLMWLLSASSSLSPCHLAVTVITHSDVSMNSEVFFTDTIFDNCVDAGEGGAILCDNDDTIFRVDLCSFLNCESGSSGGAVFVYAGSVVLLKVTARECTAVEMASFFVLNVVTQGLALHLNESSYTNGECLVYSVLTIFSPSIIVFWTNATENTRGAHGTGLALWEYQAAVVLYCRFHGNSPGTTFVFGTGGPTDTFECLEFTANTAEATDVSIGGLLPVYCDGLLATSVLSTTVNCEFTRCIFVANIVTYYVGREANFASSGTVTFRNCISDAPAFGALSPIVVNTQNCVFDW